GLAAGPVVLIVAVLILLWRRTAPQVGGLDCLDIDHVVVAHQGQRCLVLEVGPLSPDMLMLLGALSSGLRASLAAPLATRDPLVDLLQPLLGLAGVPWIGHSIPLSRDEKHLQPNVYARLFAGERQRLYGHIRTRERDIPPIRLFADRDRLEGALERPTPPHGDTPNLGKDQIPVVQVSAVAIPLVGEGVIPVAARVAGKPGLLAALHACEN